MSVNETLNIERGKTFTYVLRWGKKPVIYKAITSISQTAPAVLGVPAHGLVSGWPVAVSAVKGMKQINAENAAPRETEFHEATVLTSETIALNDVNAALYSAYIGGGYIEYMTPEDLIGAKSRFVVKGKEGGSILASYSETAGITITDASKSIALEIPAAVTAAFTWKKGVYEWEVETAAGKVFRARQGQIFVDREIAT